MANTVYRIVYINKLETRSDNKVYSDLYNVTWSLEQEGFTKVNEIENTFVRTEYVDNGILEKTNTLAVIQEVIHYEGRKMPEDLIGGYNDSQQEVYEIDTFEYKCN